MVRNLNGSVVSRVVALVVLLLSLAQCMPEYSCLILPGCFQDPMPQCSSHAMAKSKIMLFDPESMMSTTPT